MRTLNAPEDTNNLSIAGDEFPVVNGQIEVPESHIGQAMQLGCTDPDAAPIIPVMPTVDPEAAPAMIEALVEENEGLKADNTMLTTANDTCRDQVQLLTASRDEALELAEGYGQIVDGLRGSIDAARAKLVEAGLEPDEFLPAAPPAGGDAAGGAESGTEGQEGAAGASEAPADETTTEDAPERLGYEPDFDGMEYNPLLAWIKGRKVAVPANIKKVDAVKLAKIVYADQKAAQDNADKAE